MRPRPLAMSVLCLVAVACSGEQQLLDDVATDQADYEYFIPAGTAERIRSGETIEILPAELDVHVGETIRIVNEDEEGHFIGIFYVGANETVTQRFASEGEFAGNCTVHPSGRIVLRVAS